MAQTDIRLPDGVMMEDPPCEICGANDPQPVAWRTDLFLGGDTLYTHCRCGGCGVIYQHPRPTAATIGHLYPMTTTRSMYRRSRPLAGWPARCAATG